MESTIARRQVLPDDYDDEYWWHTSVSAASQIKPFLKRTCSFSVGCHGSQMGHRGCDLLNCLSLVHWRLLSCAKTDEERRPSTSIS